MDSIQTPEKMEISRKDTDSIVFSIIKKFKDRADFGMKKYGKTLDREDLTTLEWIQHAQEEHMDAILYLERIKQKYSREKYPPPFPIFDEDPSLNELIPSNK